RNARWWASSVASRAAAKRDWPAWPEAAESRPSRARGSGRGYRHPSHVPDLIRVLPRGAVGRELAHPGHVADRARPPLVGTAIGVGRALVAGDVVPEIGAYEVAVLARERVHDGPEEAGARVQLAARDH